MDNIWIVILLVIVCVVGSFYLSMFYLPLGYLGLLAAIGIIATYIYKRNRRIQ